MRSARSSHSRRTLLFTLAGFALIQCAFACFVLSDPVLPREDHWQRKLRQCRPRLAAHPDALVAAQLGSSRTGSGVCGTDAEPWLSARLGRPVLLFNVGCSGAGPGAGLINLRRMLNDGVRPHLLLLEVLPPLLDDADLLEDLTPERLPAAQLRPDEAAATAELAPRERPWLWAEWLRAQAVPAITHRQALVSLSVPGLLSAEARRDGVRGADESGYVPELPRSPGQIESARRAARERYEPALRNFRLSRRRLDLVGETIEAARSEGMAVALVLMPEGPTFRSWYPPGTWALVFGAIEGLARERGVALIDLREALDEGDLFDSHHATREGARKLTLELARRIEPLLRQAARGAP
jgi:hypothetical protein